METCTNCGASLRPGAKFCTTCGTRLNGNSPDAPDQNAWASIPASDADSQETSVLKAVEPKSETPEESTSIRGRTTSDSWGAAYSGSGSASSASGDDPASRFISALDAEVKPAPKQEIDAEPESAEKSGWGKVTSAFTPLPNSNWSYTGGETETTTSSDTAAASWGRPNSWSTPTTDEVEPASDDASEASPADSVEEGVETATGRDVATAEDAVDEEAVEETTESTTGWGSAAVEDVVEEPAQDSSADWGVMKGDQDEDVVEAKADPEAAMVDDEAAEIVPGSGEEEAHVTDAAGFSDDGDDEVDYLSGDENIEVSGGENPAFPPDEARDRAISLVDELRRMVRMMGTGTPSDPGVAAMTLTEASLNVGDYSDLRGVLTELQDDPRDIQALANLAKKADKIEALLDEHASLAQTIESAISQLND